MKHPGHCSVAACSASAVGCTYSPCVLDTMRMVERYIVCLPPPGFIASYPYPHGAIAYTIFRILVRLCSYTLQLYSRSLQSSFSLERNSDFSCFFFSRGMLGNSFYIS